MRRVLRAIAGLPHDTTVIVERRVTIGRASDTDLQLSDPEVSRRHAKVEVGLDGEVLLIDLASTTGTFVGGERVSRHTLCSGDEIEIGRFRLVYEEVADDVTERRPPAKRGMEVLRQTTRFEPGTHPSVTPAAPATERGPVAPTPPPARPTAPARAATARPQLVPREDTARIVVPQVPRMATSTIPRAPRAELDPSAPGAPAAAARLDEQTNPAVAARGVPVDPMIIRAEAMTLVRAVFDYRWLRLQQLRGEMLDHVELARMDELENQLQHGLSATATDGGHRRYRRFGCAVPGWIARFDGRRIGTVPIALEDISAGGAQVRMTDTLPTAENCWLVVDLENDAEDPVVVFGARVVWSLPGDHRLGLVFSGSVRSGIDGMELVRADAGLL